MAAALAAAAALAGGARANVLPPPPPLAGTPLESWETDGQVNAVVRSGDTVFLGGTFTFVAPPGTANAAAIPTGGPLPAPGFPVTDGPVHAVLPDGAGGWYMGGRFTRAGSTFCPHLVRVRADLTVDPAFCPRPGGVNGVLPEVRALVRKGSTLFVGGVFATIGGATRAHLAALSADTGAATPWAPGLLARGDLPGAPPAVNALAFRGTTLYVGGEFSSVGGVPRKSLAALATDTAALLPWDPRAASNASGQGTVVQEGPSATVRAIGVSTLAVYVGGDFDLIGGVVRHNLAAVHPVSGSLGDSFRTQALAGPGLPRVDDILVVGDTVYVGGAFARLQACTCTTPGFFSGTGPASGANAAALGLDGAVRPWVSGTDGRVRALAAAGSSIVLGGEFRTAGGQPRRGLAQAAGAGATTPGAVGAWDPGVGLGAAGSGVEALGASGPTILAGGAFRYVGGVDRAGLAAIDLTGRATAWNPRLERDNPPGGTAGPGVSSMALLGSTLYVMGAFDRAGGLPRPGLAAVSASTAAPTAWAPAAITDFIPQSLLAGPSFIHVLGRVPAAGSPVSPVAALTPDTGARLAWTAAVSGSAGGPTRVDAAAVDGGDLLLAGSFSAVGGQPRTRLAEVSAATGGVTAWQPPVPDGEVRAIGLRAGPPPAGPVVFVGGTFGALGGAARARAAAVNATTGALDAWAPAVSGGAVDVVRSLGPDIVLGGTFTGVGGVVRRSLALVAPEASAAVRAFDAGLDGPVRAVAADADLRLVVGGAFTRAGGRPHRGFVIFPREPEVGASSARVRATGVWSAPLACPRGTPGGCRVTARLVARGGVIGRHTARVPAGTTRRMRFPVSRRGLALLARGRVPVTVEVASTDRTGTVLRVRRRFALSAGPRA